MSDPQSQYASIKSEIDAALLRVMESGRFILGREVELLEQEVAALCGVRYGIGVASGTDALLLALLAIGVKPGDEVITTPFTFIATAEVISRIGAVPVFADVDPVTYNLSPSSVEACITPRTTAIVPVHLYGQAADMEGICKLASKYGLAVVEDVAQAIGAKRNGKPVGSFGDAAALSFYPTKNLGAAGDGGMVLTNREDVRDAVRLLRYHGSGGPYIYERLGFNSRLDELQAAVLRAKLPHLESWNAARRRNAARYTELLHCHGYGLPVEAPGNYHVFHQYTVRCRNRDELKAALAAGGVDTGIYYPLPLHLQPAFAGLGYKEGDFPESEKAAREVLSIPVFPELSEEQLHHVARLMLEFQP
ncbi:MAG: DegT/DnrJ/EryC1/StrS family aminotransferase [Armatimonadota bacterium]